MEQKMFCFQCEQTAGCSGCAGKIGVCGKTAQTAELQDKLTGALIGLARATKAGEKTTKETGKFLIDGLFATVTNVNFDNDRIKEMIVQVQSLKNAILVSNEYEV